MFSARIKRAFRTLSVRMTLWNSAIFGFGAVVVSLVAYVLVGRALHDETNDAILFRLSHYAAEYARSGREGVIELASLRRGRAQKAFFVRLADRENRTTFLRDPLDWEEFGPESLAKRTFPDDLTWIELRGIDGTHLRIASRRLSDGTLLQIGRTLENRRELLSRFRTWLLIIAAVVIVAGIPAGAFIAFRGLRPVKHLTANVRSILKTGKFTTRVPSRGKGDEVDELVQCFNTMLGQIDRLIRGMRESLENVAHDLRTPMTRLRNTASKALEADAGKEAAHEALADCLEESEHVVAMLITLMDISEAETGAMKLERQPVAVAGLAERVLDLYQHVAEERGIAVGVEIPANLQVEADALRLQRALGNLVDNALKYTPSGGRVWIRAARTDGRVAIEVSDSGDGIPAAEQSRIWERLYRVDKSRSQRGLGLGLSFVKAIVEAHGGEVAVESEPAHGSRFTIRLPAGT